MINEQAPRVAVDPEMDPSEGLRAFNRWLRVRIRAKNLTQRQLAHKSGVDHSTISRIIRGDRVPSLRTVTLLARGLGMPYDHGNLDDQFSGRTGSPMARVESLLRSDDKLDEADVRQIMHVYLAARLKRSRRVTTPARVETARRTPVPILIAVAGLLPPSTARKPPVDQR